jgi:hypothetical protein
VSGVGDLAADVYEAKRRFDAGGVEALLPRPRRPHHSPRQTPSAVEDEIVRVRKELAEEGWDNGAWSIRQRMLREGVAAPAVATINRVLVRRGQVRPAPQKRPKSAWRRFAFADRNGCWQLDGMKHKLADSTQVVIIGFEDDATRRSIRHRAAISENGEDAWECFVEGAARHGLPDVVLSDNSTAFNASRRGWTTALERNLNALGIRMIPASFHHPQTCGKRERLNGTLRRWLARQPPAQTLAELQAHLDRFDDLYNDRPHQAFDGETPNQRWHQLPVAQPTGTPPTRIHTVYVDPRGSVSVGRYLVGLGRGHTGTNVTIVTQGDEVAIFRGNELLRRLVIDPTRRYQPTGRPCGRPPG